MYTLRETTFDGLEYNRVIGEDYYPCLATTHPKVFERLIREFNPIEDEADFYINNSFGIIVYHHGKKNILLTKSKTYYMICSDGGAIATYIDNRSGNKGVKYKKGHRVRVTIDGDQYTGEQDSTVVADYGESAGVEVKLDRDPDAKHIIPYRNVHGFFEPRIKEVKEGPLLPDNVNTREEYIEYILTSHQISMAEVIAMNTVE